MTTTKQPIIHYIVTGKHPIPHTNPCVASWVTKKFAEDYMARMKEVHPKWTWRMEQETAAA